MFGVAPGDCAGDGDGETAVAEDGGARVGRRRADADALGSGGTPVSAGRASAPLAVGCGSSTAAGGSGSPTAGVLRADGADGADGAMVVLALSFRLTVASMYAP